MTTERRNGLLIVLLATVGYACLPIITEIIYAQTSLEPTDVAIWRFAFATPVIWLAVWSRNSAKDAHLPRFRLMSLGIFYAAAALTAFISLRYINASTYVVLFFTYPAMVTLISFVTGTSLSKTAWVALGMTMLGIVLTVPDFSLLTADSALGIAMALLNALVVALYFIFVGKVMGKTKAVTRGSAWVITGTLLVLLAFIPFFGLTFPATLNGWGLLLAMAVIGTALPILFINIGIQKIGAAQASIISTIEPVETMILALLLLGEVIVPMQWVGAAFIIAAVVLLELRNARASKSPVKRT